MHRGRLDGVAREAHEGDQRGLQEVQGECVVQKERRNTRRTLSIDDVSFWYRLFLRHQSASDSLLLLYFCLRPFVRSEFVIIQVQ